MTDIFIFLFGPGFTTYEYLGYLMATIFLCGFFCLIGGMPLYMLFFGIRHYQGKS